MKRALLIAAALFVLLLILSGVALYFFDPETLRGPLQRQAATALGRDVTLGKISLAIFPLPAVRVDDIRIAGPTPSSTAFAEISELRLRVSILPLLARRVVLRALEIDSPRIDIPFDKDGKPILPAPAKTPSEKKEKPEDAEKKEDSASAQGFALAVDRIAIDGARVQFGPWLVENASLTGRLSLDGSGAFSFALDLPGLGELRNGGVELTGLGSPALAVSAQSEFSADLATLRERFKVTPEISGRARGEFEVEVVAGALQAANANVDVPDLLVRSGDLVVSGPTRAHAVLGESYSLDLSDARVEKTGVFAKPKRTPLSVTGTLGLEPNLSAVRDTLVKFGANVIPLSLELGRTPMHVHVKKSLLDLGRLRELLTPDRPPLAGIIHVDALDITLDPLGIDGNAVLDGVETTLEHGPVRISGPMHGSGRQVELEKGSAVVVGGQTIALTATYDLASGATTATYDTSNTQLGQLLAALSGHSEIDGTLASSGKLAAAKPEVAALAGGGRVDVRPGRIQGFSLAKAIAVPLAGLAGIKGAEGATPGSVEDETFEYLSADYVIADGRLSSENLELKYQNATAFLHGSVGMSDRTLDLAGRIVLTKEGDAALTGSTKRAKERVIPIAHITGTVDSPRIALDQKTLAALALAYSGNDKVREKIDKALGPGGAEAVEDFLGNLLGGKKKK